MDGLVRYASTSADLLTLIKERRSARAFSERPVEREELELLIDAARWAPSPTNRQPWKFLTIASPTLKALMRESVAAQGQELLKLAGEDAPALDDYLKNFVFFSEAPVVIALLLRRTRSRLGEDSSIEADSGLLALGAAMQNVLLAAAAAGMAACPMTGPLIARQELEDVLEIKDPWQLKALIPVGWPSEEIPSPPERKRPDLVWQEVV